MIRFNEKGTCVVQTKEEQFHLDMTLALFHMMRVDDHLAFADDSEVFAEAMLRAERLRDQYFNKPETEENAA